MKKKTKARLVKINCINLEDILISRCLNLIPLNEKPKNK